MKLSRTSVRSGVLRLSDIESGIRCQIYLNETV